MNHITGIVIVALLFAIIFAAALFKFRQVTGEIRTPLGSGKLRAQEQTQAAAKGSVEIAQIRAEAIKIGDLTGAKGPTAAQGGVRVADLTTQKGIEIGNAIGLDQDASRE